MDAKTFAKECADAGAPMPVQDRDWYPHKDSVHLRPGNFRVYGDFTPEQQTKAEAAVHAALGGECGWAATVHVSVPGRASHGRRSSFGQSAPEPDVATQRALASAIVALESDVSRWEKLVKHANRALKKLHKQQAVVAGVRFAARNLDPSGGAPFGAEEMAAAVQRIKELP